MCEEIKQGKIPLAGVMTSFNVSHELPITSFLIGIIKTGLAVLVGECQKVGPPAVHAVSGKARKLGLRCVSR
jgi:hypothetical protein